MRSKTSAPFLLLLFVWNDGRNEVERGRITTSRGVDAKREIPKIKFSLP